MLAIIKTIDGVKKIIPVTADVGAGLPVGTIIAQYKKTTLSGYLYLDGSTFDQTAYPLLYAYLGSNVLPDYREFALVGAEQNTTDVYNASTNPNGTIHDHDVYTEGQAKDDCMQEHTHSVDTTSGSASYSGYLWANNTGGAYVNMYTNGIRNARKGTVTRGKRKAVYFYIKATSGLSENAQDNVINIMKEYIRNQNVLSAVENISLSTTSTSPTTMDYDGLLVMSVSGGPRTVYVNGAGYVLVGDVVSGTTALTSVTVPFRKGDKLYTNSVGNVDVCKVQYYKLRDYSDRT